MWTFRCFMYICTSHVYLYRPCVFVPAMCICTGHVYLYRPKQKSLQNYALLLQGTLQLHSSLHETVNCKYGLYSEVKVGLSFILIYYTITETTIVITTTVEYIAKGKIIYQVGVNASVFYAICSNLLFVSWQIECLCLQWCYGYRHSMSHL